MNHINLCHIHLVDMHLIDVHLINMHLDHVHLCGEALSHRTIQVIEFRKSAQHDPVLTWVVGRRLHEDFDAIECLIMFILFRSNDFKSCVGRCGVHKLLLNC